MSEATNPQSANNLPAAALATTAPAVTIGDSFALLLDRQKFEVLCEHAKFISGSDIIPDHYRGKAANIVIAFMSAGRLQVDPLMFLSQTYITQGKLGVMSQLVIAIINNRFLAPRHLSPLKFEFKGEGLTEQCVAYTENAKGERVMDGPEVTMAMVKAEGWYGDDNGMKKGRKYKDKEGIWREGAPYPSKWKTLKPLMFRYRSAAFFGRTNCPDVMLGLATIEELEDTDAIETTATRIDESAAAPVPMPKEKPAPSEPAKNPQASPAVHPTASTGETPAAASSGQSSPPPQNPQPANSGALIGTAEITRFWTAFWQAFPASQYGREGKKAQEIFKALGYSNLKEVTVARFPELMQALETEVAKSGKSAGTAKAEPAPSGNSGWGD